MKQLVSQFGLAYRMELPAPASNGATHNIPSTPMTESTSPRDTGPLPPTDLEGNLPAIEDIEAELDGESLSSTDKGQA